jgi:hypothetical protein
MWPADWDVFISYKQGEGEAVDEIADALAAAGMRVWIDRDKLRAGERFDEPILAALRGSTVVLCLITERYQQSEYCMMEYRHALGRRLPVRLKPGLELCAEIRQNGETVPGEWSVAALVDMVNGRLLDEAERARSNKRYLSCDRKAEWKVLRRPAAARGPRLILVPGDHFQGHEHLLDRVRFFQELKPCQVHRVEWRGGAGPAELDYRNALVDALIPPKNVATGSRWSGSIGALLKQRTEHAQLVLLHKLADGDFATAPEEHNLFGYYRWLAQQPEVGSLPLVCVQPVSWKTWSNWLEFLAVWKRWRAKRQAGKLMRGLASALAGWELSLLEPLQSITKTDLRAYAGEHNLQPDDFVAYTYDRRSIKVLDSIQTYRPSQPPEP